MRPKTYEDGVMETFELIGRVLRIKHTKRKIVKITRQQIRESIQEFRDDCKKEAKKWKDRYYDLKHGDKK